MVQLGGIKFGWVFCSCISRTVYGIGILTVTIWVRKQMGISPRWTFLAFSPTVMCVDYFSLVHKSQEVQCDSPTLQNVLIVPGALCNVVIAFIFMTVLLLTFMHVSVGAKLIYGFTCQIIIS